jgi:hypothetical protein
VSPSRWLRIQSFQFSRTKWWNSGVLCSKLALTWFLLIFSFTFTSIFLPRLSHSCSHVTPSPSAISSSLTPEFSLPGYTALDYSNSNTHSIMATSTTNSPPKTTLPPWSLMNLPPELHLEIIDQLRVICDRDDNDVALSVQALRLTSRHFHRLIPALDHATLDRIQDTDFAIEHHLYACRLCVRLRPRSEFDDRMIKYSYIHEHRTCADCAFKPLDKGGEYAFGTKVKVGTEWVVRCVWCREVKRGVEAEGCNCEEICAYRLCGCKNPCLTCSTDRGGRC